MSTRVFIVEDERIVAEDIRMTLESNGYTVAGIAASRDEAIAGIQRTSPDLVLMDIVLKGQGDGVEAARLVRELYDIPVVYLTAHADQATLRRAKITEPFGYILKPFEDRDLFSGVEIALYRHRVEKRIEDSERWLATILASITDGVIAADALGVVKLVNAAAERIAGWTQSEAAGLDVTEVYRVRDVASGLPVELPSLPALIEAVNESPGREVRFLTRKDGSSTVVEQRISLIGDGPGTVSGTVLVFRELTSGTEMPGVQP